MTDKQFPYINRSGQTVYKIIPGDGKYIEYWEVTSPPDAAIEGMSGVWTKDGIKAFTLSDEECERMRNMLKNNDKLDGFTINHLIKPALYIVALMILTFVAAWLAI